ncbi:superoxide dismutase family protein [Frankia sp. QA3]|uniref:superoxide dismutase family protein n=1 Tax=Frankia sp. QA3 TaxID=710111 RepID=UPI000269D08A|nr:superoxide dismutase family protein [Frankia sp. QA3]EIV95406.1 Copper/zinc superoxide dismutase (SODC) [Frankia sp. QA3]
MRRRLSIIAAGLGLILLTAGPAGAAGSPSPSPPGAGQVVVAPGVFSAWNDRQPPTAVTYDEHLVPAGATAVALAVRGKSTVIGLIVQGLAPNHQFGAHVHQKACGATGAAAGPHYQNVPDPVQPSVDPEYANARNEVWLDFTTDARGTGAAFAVVGWDFRTGGAHAIVFHEHHTDSSVGAAGTAGARAACLTVPLS